MKKLLSFILILFLFSCNSEDIIYKVNKLEKDVDGLENENKKITKRLIEIEKQLNITPPQSSYSDNTSSEIIYELTITFIDGTEKTYRVKNFKYENDWIRMKGENLFEEEKKYQYIDLYVYTVKEIKCRIIKEEY